MPVQQMNISLSPQMARFIRARVKKGDYKNVSEVVRDVVRSHVRADVFFTKVECPRPRIS